MVIKTSLTPPYMCETDTPIYYIKKATHGVDGFVYQFEDNSWLMNLLEQNDHKLDRNVAEVDKWLSTLGYSHVKKAVIISTDVHLDSECTLFSSASSEMDRQKNVGGLNDAFISNMLFCAKQHIVCAAKVLLNISVKSISATGERVVCMYPTSHRGSFIFTTCGVNIVVGLGAMPLAAIVGCDYALGVDAVNYYYSSRGTITKLFTGYLVSKTTMKNMLTYLIKPHKSWLDKIMFKLLTMRRFGVYYYADKLCQILFTQKGQSDIWVGV